jgi:hypothetical protein
MFCKYNSGYDIDEEGMVTILNIRMKYLFGTEEMFWKQRQSSTGISKRAAESITHDSLG